jgi:hypothetical protein
MGMLISTTNAAGAIRHVCKAPCPDRLSVLAIVVMHVWKKRVSQHLAWRCGCSRPSSVDGLREEPVYIACRAGHARKSCCVAAIKVPFLSAFSLNSMCTRCELPQCAYGMFSFAMDITFSRGHRGQIHWTTLSWRVDTRRTLKRCRFITRSSGQGCVMATVPARLVGMRP